MADLSYTIPSPTTKSIKGSKAGSSGQTRVTKSKSNPKSKPPISLSPESNTSTESSIQASCKSPQVSPEKPQPTLPKSPRTLPEKPKPTLAKSPKQAKLPGAVKSSNPTMLNMVLEALKNNKSVKGLTLQGMKRYITETYPDTKESFSNARLRTAIMKGLEGTEVVRPKSSEETGVKGHFLLNRVLHSQKEKVKKQALKTEEKKSASNETDKKPKKISKVAKRKRSLSKSMSEKSSSPKSKTSGQKLSNSASLKKPRALKSKTPEQKQSKVVKKDVKKVSKKSKDLTSKKTPISKSHATKITGTPKLSRSMKAGAKQKTATVRKLKSVE